MKNYKEQFKDFLIQQGAYEAYQIETKRNFDEPDFLLGDFPSGYLMTKLTWAKTKNGYQYWKELNDLWMWEIK